MRRQVHGTEYAQLAEQAGGGGFPAAVTASEGSLAGPACAVEALTQYLALELDPELEDAQKPSATSIVDRRRHFDLVFARAEDQVGLPRNKGIRDFYEHAVPAGTYGWVETSRGLRWRHIAPPRDYEGLRIQCEAYLEKIKAAQESLIPT